MILKGTITQTGADTFTSAQILTGLTVDGKSGWEILGFKGVWWNGNAAPAADLFANLQLATVATTTVPSSDDEIARVSWGVQNTAGVAVAVGFEPIKKAEITEPRVTVQSDLYVAVSTSNTAQANQFYWELSFNIIKLTDLEVLRLAVGGA